MAPIRRLAAILATDVVGYSRLIGQDEEGTVARLHAVFRETVQPTLKAHRGRVFKLMGDAFLAEFASAVDAVRCAIALQEAVGSREDCHAADLKIRFRIGVHLGDVLVEGADLLGDGVNIASRLEGVADPGGIAVSAAVAEAVSGRVPFGFQDIGERALKNIDRPMRVFSVSNRAERPSAHPPSAGLKLTVPTLPSLAVLPFQNMSGNPEQEYFADGITEELTAALSRIRSFFVIARNSAFTYKGRAVDVHQIGRDLGVRYVLEGSVRRAGEHVRIVCQLVEAASRSYIWTNSFDGDLDDVFGLQDRVTEAVASAVEPTVQAVEVERARHKPTGSLDAYDLYLRALSHVYSATRKGSEEALTLLRGAAALDPGFALAKALAAFTQANRYEQGWIRPGDREEGIRLASEAAAHGHDNPMTLALAARTFGFLAHDRGRVVAAAERALGLNPNSAFVRGVAGWAANYVAKPVEAKEHFWRALRLSPLDPERAYFLSGLAYAHVMQGEYEDAFAAGARAISEKPGRATQYRTVIVALHCLARREELAPWVAAYREAVPEGARVFADRVSALFADQKFATTVIGALRAAGLPE